MSGTTELPAARDLLRALRDDLDIWIQRLLPIAEGVEGAEWEEDTDEPRNAAARIQGVVDVLLSEDLPELRRQIERALR